MYSVGTYPTNILFRLKRYLILVADVIFKSDELVYATYITYYKNKNNWILIPSRSGYYNVECKILHGNGCEAYKGSGSFSNFKNEN